MRRALAILASGVVLGGCGSTAAEDLPAPPAPAGPPAPMLDGAAALEVDAQARELVLRDAETGEERTRIPAGAGPTSVVSDGGRWAWVVDTGSDGLLVVRLTGDDDLEIERRVYLPGRPERIVRADGADGARLFVTLTETGEVAELPAHGRPHVLATRPAP